MTARKTTGMKHVLTLAVLVGVLAMPLWGLANMANPMQPGDLVGEPSDALRGLRIVHERLRFDLRPLADTSMVVVEATYQVQVEDAVRTVDLVFVPGAVMGPEAGVWLDEKPVRSTRTDTLALPDTWQPPPTTPRPAGGRSLAYEAEGYNPGGEVLLFGVTMTSGAHTIRVRYHARPGEYADPAERTKFWQLGYVLAPARQWDDFGDLEVAVWLPQGWHAATEPALTRSGDVLIGIFPEIPSDALAITVQAPLPETGGFIAALPWLVGVLGLLLGAWMGARAGRWLGHHRRTSAWALPFSIILAIIWSFVLIAASSVQYQAGREALGHQASWTYGYGDQYLFVVGLPLLFLLALILIQGVAFIARRRVEE